MPHRPSRRTFLKGVAGAAGAAVPLVSHRRTTAQTPATVKYLTWWWAEKGRNDAWRGIVKKFHDAQKDIRIQEVGFPYSEFFQRVTTQLAGGRLERRRQRGDDPQRPARRRVQPVPLAGRRRVGGLKWRSWSGWHGVRSGIMRASRCSSR